MIRKSIALIAALGLLLAASVSFSGETSPAGSPQRFGAAVRVKKPVTIAQLA